MLAVNLVVDFTCRLCGGPVSVTLRCEGEGLAVENAAASTRIPCPGCGDYNKIVFSPDGTLHRVIHERSRCRLLEPCSN